MKIAFFILTILGVLPGLSLAIVLLKPQNQIDPNSLRNRARIATGYGKAEVSVLIMRVRVLGIPISVSPVGSLTQKLSILAILVSVAVYLTFICAVLNYEIRIRGSSEGLPPRIGAN
jgi:hypothetical protein